MNFSWRAWLMVAALSTSESCGGQNAAPPPPDQSTNPVTSISAAEATGRIASALAPPATLVMLEPADDVELPVKKQPAVMDQAGYEFLPAFLVAQAGQTVQFRNSEDVLHNVRVAEAAGQQPVFNIATVAFGKYDHVFQPGYYNVTCDIHPTMRASILVTKTPYATSTADDGTFAFRDVVPGRYNLTIYAGQQPIVRPVEVKNGKTDFGTIG